MRLITIELSWLDNEHWGSVWRCTPDGKRLHWDGFKRLDAALLRSPAVRAVSTVVAHNPELRRALITLVSPTAGDDGAQAVTRSHEGTA